MVGIKNVPNKQFLPNIKLGTVIDFKRMGIVPMGIGVNLFTAIILAFEWSTEKH